MEEEAEQEAAAERQPDAVEPPAAEVALQPEDPAAAEDMPPVSLPAADPEPVSAPVSEPEAAAAEAASPAAAAAPAVSAAAPAEEQVEAYASSLLPAALCLAQ